jgi:hypothetical protein
MTPRETDTALAALYHELSEIEQQLAYNASSLLSLARAKYYYRGRRRVTDMSVDDAIAILTAQLDEIAAYLATHQRTESDGYVSTDWNEYRGLVAPYDVKRIEPTLAQRDELLITLAKQHERIDALQATYTGWSRFFLVTSSTGHVHSSMSCSTCRPTTTFGWLPELSGKTEQLAVEQLGPTLCSVCFPSAPVEWTSGKKITAAQAARQAA